MTNKSTALALVSAVFLSSFSFAQAPVVERTIDAQGAPSSANDQTAAVRNNYLEIQALREEVSSLRGLIEELSYELRKMQERQDEDYQDLDRRVSSGSGAPQDSGSPLATTRTTSGPSAGSPSPAQSASVGGGSQAEVDVFYRNGFNALRDGQRAEAVSIFQELVDTYPGSSREADSLFWLGETHWLDLEIEKSRQSFTRLLDAYPGYRKAADAKYRLGLIYAQLGETEKALEYMSALAEGDNTQSDAARTYLQEQGNP